jgi:hypothetical protein
VAAPAFAAAVSAFYFRKHRDVSPLRAASIVLAFIALVDFLLVALIILRSLDMFRSFLGTWLPLLLIFAATALAGAMARRISEARPAGSAPPAR